MEQFETSYIQRIIDGEIDLFSIFVNRYNRSVHQLIKQIVPLQEDTEELVQDTFLKAYKKLDKFKGECSFSTWIYKIAYNTAVSHNRKKRVVLPVIDDKIIESIEDESVDIFFGQAEEGKMKQLEAAMLCLSMEEKALLTLFYTDDKSIADIAHITNLSVENTKVRLHRIRKKLFKLMEMSTETYETR